MYTSHTCGAQTLQEKIAVMQAFADGETVELYNCTTKQWNPIAAPIWDWHGSKYRIAPKTLSAEDIRRAKVVEAYKAGAEIESCRRVDGLWRDVGTPFWFWDDSDYRVKETPPTLVTFYTLGGATRTFIRGSRRHEYYSKLSNWTELT